MLEALIFDVDGTLAETEELHRRAFNEVFAEAGLAWNWTQDDYRALLKTTGGKERIAHHVTTLGVNPAELPVAALHAAKTTRYVSLMASGQIVLRPGIAGLIAEAYASGVRLAIATTTSLPNVDALTRAVFGKTADQVFEVVVGGDMVNAKKPAPDVYFLALHQLGLSANQAVALEDSRNGLRAAKAAGLICCVSPGVYTIGEDFSEADLVIPEFSEMSGLATLAAMVEQKK